MTGVARKTSVCARPGCRLLIRVGYAIVRRPEGAYMHENCAAPGRRSRATRDVPASRAGAAQEGTTR
jgi:hypothetical protein